MADSVLRYCNSPTWTSLTGTSDAGRGIKNRDFRPISRFISEIIQDSVTGTVLWVPRLSNGTVFNDLARLLTNFQGHAII